MEQRCTCGALLPPDSRFCNKCGKPQYEEDIQRIAAFEAAAVPRPVALPAAVAVLPESGVTNLRAIGITIVAAALALIGIMLIGRLVPPSLPLILCAAGFAAARFYGDKRSISALSGALLGTMTGLWLFLIFALCIGTASVVFATPEGQAAIKGLPDQAQVAQVMHMIQDPHQLFTGFIIPVFFFIILSAAFGGLLAVSTRRPSR